MKKVIFWLLSLFLITPVFANQSEFVVSSWWVYYLCYVNNISAWNTSSRTYYISPFRCWSINSNNGFSESFSFNNNFWPFTFSNQATISSYALRFFSWWLKYSNQVNYMSNSQYYYSFPLSSLTTDWVYPWYNFLNTLVYSNLNNWAFLSFNWNSINWSLYNNYYFESDSYFSNVSSYYYNLDISSSSVSLSWDNYSFVSIFDDTFSTNNFWKIVSFDWKVNWVLLIPLLDYWYNYLTWSHTMLLKNINWNLVYNILDCFSSQSLVLKNCSVSDRWYFNDLTFFNNSWYNYNITPSYLGWSYYKKYKFAFYSWSSVILYYFDWFNDSTSNYDTFINRSKSFELTSNFNAPEIFSSIQFPITWWQVIDILETLCNSSFIKPIFCNWVDQVSTWVDWFWDLDWSWNLIYTLINTDPNNMGWGDITPDWSWGFNITCSDQDWFWCPLLENAWLSWYLDYWSWFILGTDYYETFFQKTGRFFACPYWYVVLDTNSFLKILNKFNQISESIGFDFMLPINCSIAAFTHWKNYKFLKDVDLWLNPLMWDIQGPDDPRVYLYRFFDFLMSVALLFFLLKLYHLIF